MPAPELAPLDEMVDRLERVVEGSPADSTELAWVEAVRHLESNGKRRRDTFERRERTVFVRVRERGRTGLHRTGAAGLSDLDAAVRQALAHARMTPAAAAAGNGAAPQPASAAEPAGPAIIPVGASPLFDPELARLAGPWAREPRPPAGGRKASWPGSPGWRGGWRSSAAAACAAPRAPPRRPCR